MRFAVLLFSFLLTLPFSARAEIVSSEHTEAELVSETLSIQPGVPFWAALRMKMDERWHTYWRNPGDSGIPTEIRWELPEGFSAGETQWPVPKKVDLPPLAVYAYEGEVFLLAKITPPADLVPGSSQALKAQAFWLECEVNCIPGDASLSLELPVTAETPEPDLRWVEAFARTRAELPLSSSGWSVTAETNEKQIRIFISQAEASSPLSGVSFFPYDEKLIDHPSAQRFSAVPGGYELIVERSRLRKGAVDSLQGILVSKDGWRGRGSEKSLEIDVPAPLVETRWAGGETGSMTAVLAALLAFAGGLLLNLMPCVFPVISLKILHFVETARESRARMLMQGGAFTLGVLVSFWILAAALLILRSAGQEIGWGFQLQNPGVVAALASLFFVLSLNLFGFFEVGLSLTSAGSGASRHSGLSGVFFNGVLATIVATPCTAPFMGSALGYAVTRSAAEALVIFTALGAGMAAPYLLLSAFPQWIRKLPKPGKWMDQLKKIFGIFILATALWLVWVLDLQAGRTALKGLAAGWMLLFTAGFFYGRLQRRGDRKNIPLFFLILLLGAAGAGLPFFFLNPAGTVSQNASQDSGWEKFSEARLRELLEAGRPVLVDFTAAWCLTCQVNERVVLDSSRVRERFNVLGVTLLKADWTSRDPEITRALAGYGRSSVPFYVLYGRGKGQEPVYLPEILTASIVLEALEKIPEPETLNNP